MNSVRAHFTPLLPIKSPGRVYERRILPRMTLEGLPARAFCHLCSPVQAFPDIDAVTEHMHEVHVGRQG